MTQFSVSVFTFNVSPANRLLQRTATLSRVLTQASDTRKTSKYLLARPGFSVFPHQSPERVPASRKRACNQPKWANPEHSVNGRQAKESISVGDQQARLTRSLSRRPRLNSSSRANPLGDPTVHQRILTITYNRSYLFLYIISHLYFGKF